LIPVVIQSFPTQAAEFLLYLKHLKWAPSFPFSGADNRLLSGVGYQAPKTLQPLPLK
jgi:hypothetical protein